MKLLSSLTSWALLAGSASAFVPSKAATSSTALHMVLEKPKEKKLAKIEMLKIESDHLIHPLKEVCTFLVAATMLPHQACLPIHPLCRRPGLDLSALLAADPLPA